MARDTQRSRLYAWERGLGLHDEALTLDGCRAVLGRVADGYGWSTVHVKDGRGTRTAYARGSTVSLPVWARNHRVVLHEMAHVLMGYGDHASHGPEFVRLYIDLLVRYHPEGPRASSLGPSARAAGLRVARADAVPLPLTREARRIRRDLASADDARRAADDARRAAEAACREANDRCSELRRAFWSARGRGA
ncbi:MAG: hypothetical protein Q7U75_08885 [Desulfobacterales bacterium]|nr:hypothetical protein [Desulfobacterales bacterium]